MKSFVDSNFLKPRLLYRKTRDYLKWQFSTAENTPLGFKMFGKEDIDATRTASKEVETFQKYLPECDAFVDVGANTGFFTLLATSEGVRTISIEPHPYNFDLLLRNVYLNEISIAELYHGALSRSVGVFPLYGGGQGASLHRGWGGIKSTYQTLVATTTLSNILNSRFRQKRLLVKIDVEGAEYDVLQGGKSLLDRTPKPTWIIENSISRNHPNRNPHFKDIFNLFWDRGYDALSIDTEDRYPITQAEVARWYSKGHHPSGVVNYLFVYDE